MNDWLKYDFTSRSRRMRGTVVRAEAQRSDDPCVAGSNPTVGRGWNRINRGSVSQWVLHLKESLLLETMTAKHRSKFAAQSPVLVTAAWLLRSAAKKQASRSRIFHSYGAGLQNLGLCSALRVFEQQNLLPQSTSVFPVSSEGPPHLVASYDTKWDAEDLF
jgi:hypothetical protein